MPPASFRQAVAQLKAVGLLPAIELSAYDLAAQWKRFDGPSNPTIVCDLVLADRPRAYELPALELIHFVPQAADYLRRLSEITAGALIIDGVAEIWNGRRLERIDLEIGGRGWTLSPRLVTDDDGRVSLEPVGLLGALNVTTDTGQFALLNEHAIFLTEEQRVALVATGVNVEPVAEHPDAIASATVGALRQPATKTFVELERAAGGADRPEVNYKRVVRRAFEPVMREGPEQLAKFGGRPWLPPNCYAPKCPGCLAPTGLLFQAPLAELPIPTLRRGVLQVYLCKSSDGGGDCFMRWTGVVVRIETRPVTVRPRRDGDKWWCFPLLPIVEWEPFDDHPGPDDWDRVNLDADRAEEDEIGPHAGWKCGGWPDWKQGRNDMCPDCGEPALLALQVPEHDDIYFGDSGSLYILVCDNPGFCSWSGGVIQYH